MKSNIDESLNMLKQLEMRLKNQKSHTTPLSRKKESEQTTHPEKLWGEKLISDYESTGQALQKQNQQLKKYVRKLLKMNDYLKNQLIQGDYHRKTKDP